MKTKRIKKVMIVGSVLLIGVAICISVWFFLSEYKVIEIQDQSQQSLSNAGKATNNETSKIVAPSNDREEPVTRREIVARQSRRMFKSLLSEEQFANPHFQKMLEVMDSPEFAELPMPPSIRQWNDLLESKGIPVTRGRPGVFTKQPPFISLDDYEPIVRQGMAELFLAQEPVDMTDPEAALSLRVKIFGNLDNVVANGRRWFWERFGEDWDGIFRVEGMENNRAVIWLNDIQQNAASIVAAAEQARSGALEASAPSWDLSSVMESPPVFPDEMEGNRPGMVVPSIDTDEQYDTEKRTAATPMVDPEKGVTDVLPTLPEAPTGEEVETALREQFSSERFDRAMSTLERYGPEEGLRRLKESDPEVAEQVERHRNRKEISK